MSKAININGEGEFDKEVRQSDLPVLVDFWAPWCMPCRMMAPILDSLSDNMDGKLKVVKVDTENPAHNRLAMEFNIRSIPNMKLFKNGEMVSEFIGLRDLETIQAEISSLL